MTCSRRRKLSSSAETGSRREPGEIAAPWRGLASAVRAVLPFVSERRLVTNAQSLILGTRLAST